MNALMVFAGGGLGSVLRYGAGLLIPSAALPWATLAVNVVGSFAIGVFGGYAERFDWPDGLRLASTVGLCGGFTTFSTLSKESLAMLQQGRYGMFASYAAGSVMLGIAAVALGYFISRQ